MSNEYIEKYKELYEPIFGYWYIKRFIGEGSFAKVFEICRKDFGVEYTSALKIINVAMNRSEIKARQSQGMTSADIKNDLNQIVSDTLKEISLMHDLKGHTNIVAYEDHKVKAYEDSMCCDILIKMELLTPLDDYIEKNNGVLSLKTILKLGVDLCRALEVCGRHHIIHRDIKFENVFVSKDGDFKLGDFGIARVLEKKDNEVSKKGTSTYMAPEVYRGERYDATVDIYGVGMVLYRLLNNARAPFLPVYPAPLGFDDRDRALMRRMSGETLPFPHAMQEGRLAEIVLKACAYDPKERYADPYEMRMALETLLHNIEERDILIYEIQGGVVVEDRTERDDKTEVLKPSPEGASPKKKDAVQKEHPISAPKEKKKPTVVLPQRQKPTPKERPAPAPKAKKERDPQKEKLMKLILGGVCGLAVLILLLCLLISSCEHEEPDETASTTTTESAKTSKTETTATTTATTPVSESTVLDWYTKATNYYSAGDYANAFIYYEKAANAGHTESEYMIGICYNNGRGVNQNYTSAFSWFKKAANEGHTDAEYMLGYCYYYGRGVSKNYVNAFSWLEKAANAGHVRAMRFLGDCYYNGDGASENYAMAAHWYKKAANAGDAHAMYLIGYCTYYGQGVAKDDAGAFSWFQRAAQAGNADGMCMLAECYYYGNGVTKNLKSAHEWYCLAANAGNGRAMYMLAERFYSAEGEWKDLDKAEEYYQKATAAGYSGAKGN